MNIQSENEVECSEMVRMIFIVEIMRFTLWRMRLTLRLNLIYHTIREGSTENTKF